MLKWLTKRDDTALAARRIYGAVVAQSRQPYFYSNIGIPDTPEGRLEMLILHLFLAAEALRGQGAVTEPLNRALIESFVGDIDDCMREMGVGDLTVPKRVRKATETFYSRSGGYRAALNSDHPEAAVAAFVSSSLEVNGAADWQRLAVYIVRQHRHGRGAPAGMIAFLPPDSL